MSILLGIGYVIPALAWLGTLSTSGSGAKGCFAGSYFFFHFLVEAYSIAMPIYYLGWYWNDPNATFTLAFNTNAADQNGDN